MLSLHPALVMNELMLPDKDGHPKSRMVMTVIWALEGGPQPYQLQGQTHTSASGSLLPGAEHGMFSCTSNTLRSCVFLKRPVDFTQTHAGVSSVQQFWHQFWYAQWRQRVKFLNSSRKHKDANQASFISGDQGCWWKRQKASSIIIHFWPFIQMKEKQNSTRISLSPSVLVAIVREWAFKIENEWGWGAGERGE